MTIKRCAWVGNDTRYMRYHDEEWGVPVHDDQILFEFLLLEGAQAGLSWSTILNKRDHYRWVFDRFDPQGCATKTSQINRSDGPSNSILRVLRALRGEFSLTLGRTLRRHSSATSSMSGYAPEITANHMSRTLLVSPCPQG